MLAEEGNELLIAQYQVHFCGLSSIRSKEEFLLLLTSDKSVALKTDIALGLLRKGAVDLDLLGAKESGYLLKYILNGDKAEIQWLFEFLLNLHDQALAKREHQIYEPLKNFFRQTLNFAVIYNKQDLAQVLLERKVLNLNAREMEPFKSGTEITVEGITFYLKTKTSLLELAICFNPDMIDLLLDAGAEYLDTDSNLLKYRSLLDKRDKSFVLTELTEVARAAYAEKRELADVAYFTIITKLICQAIRLENKASLLALLKWSLILTHVDYIQIMLLEAHRMQERWLSPRQYQYLLDAALWVASLGFALQTEVIAVLIKNGANPNVKIPLLRWSSLEYSALYIALDVLTPDSNNHIEFAGYSSGCPLDGTVSKIIRLNILKCLLAHGAGLGDESDVNLETDIPAEYQLALLPYISYHRRHAAIRAYGRVLDYPLVAPEVVQSPHEIAPVQSEAGLNAATHIVAPVQSEADLNTTTHIIAPVQREAASGVASIMAPIQAATISRVAETKVSQGSCCIIS